MFSLASTLLSTIASPAFQVAYEKVCSIWEAKNELHKLRRSIQTIQSVLLDAEKKQESSAAIKDWVGRVRDVLYDADDLFDEVATDHMLKEQLIKEDKPLKKVRAYCFKLNPIIFRDSIAKKVKDIRKRLLEISTDMAQFEFVNRQHEELISSGRKGQDPGSFVDSKDVVGRVEDKKVVLELLLNGKSNQGEHDVSVIAIVGIGGMGKTTLAQLVYNDEEIQKNFDKRWFACISDISDDKEVLGKIFQSLCEESYGNFTLGQLQAKIRKSVKGEKFLLVLDDVWDEDRARWQHRMSLLRGGAEGSKVIVTTRSLSVARAMGALEPHNLEDLSDDESWDLFKRVAFTPEQEKDLRWANLGREIVKKCARVPLAIRCVGSLLYTKATIQEWESFKDNQLSKLELSGDSIMQTLKLSYDHLPSNLKHCFAYCSLFPKDYVFDMDDLIYLWIAQGYIKPNYQAGYSCFMDLHRRSFFQKDEDCNVTMHDLFHDLAHHVSGEEFTMLTKPPNQLDKRARHVSVGHEVDTSWGSVAQMLNTSRLRSLVFLPRRYEDQCLLLALDQQFKYGKHLRALSWSYLEIRTVSSCIGELKHLRYLNLSGNLFESLPDSLTNLLNLLILDIIGGCKNLKSLPDSFRKLINMRHLKIEGCIELKHMPPGMGELSCLHMLSTFKLGNAIKGVKRSGLGALARLKLRGQLKIEFSLEIDNWDGDESWQMPVSLDQLDIFRYPGRRIPHWSNHPSLQPNLAHLTLRKCHKVKHLPPLRCLPNLKLLRLHHLRELEYIEEEEEDHECAAVEALFFPLLGELKMNMLPKLKGWSRRKVAVTTESSAGSASPHLFLSFPLLSRLKIRLCKELTSFPLCPCVRELEIEYMDGGMMQHLLSASLEEMSITYWKGLVSFPDEAFPSLKICTIYNCPSLENLCLLASPLLKDLKISTCDGLKSVEVEALPSLVSLEITYCSQLKNLHIARLNALLELIIQGCPEELELWGIQQDKRCTVDWDSLPNLRQLDVDHRPEELPDCIRHLQALDQLKIFCTHV